MSRAVFASPAVTPWALVGVAAALSACASSPDKPTAVQSASNYADQGAHAIYRTGGDVAAGVGTAAKQPFRDLNMMQDPIPMVLLRAELDPYAVAGLTSCESVLNHVAELDLALGPDMDSPRDQAKSRVTRDASLAAAAALEAAAAAAEGFMPVRSVIKHVSGATKYEDHVKHAVLAGIERRAFLKAVGAMHNCGWPAAPLTVSADQAKIIVAWTLPAEPAAPREAPSAAPIMTASAVKTPPTPSPSMAPPAITLASTAPAPPLVQTASPASSAGSAAAASNPSPGAPNTVPASAATLVSAPASTPAYTGAPWGGPAPSKQ